MPVGKDQEEKARSGALAVALSVGWELASFTVLGFALGYWADGRFDSSPWGVLVSTLTGIVAGLYRLVRTFSSSANGGTGRG